MKTFAKVLSALLLVTAVAPAVFAQTPTATTAAAPAAKTIKHRKGGYVHATTFVTKKGTVVHRKGGYRHATMVAVKKAKKS